MLKNCTRYQYTIHKVNHPTHPLFFTRTSYHSPTPNSYITTGSWWPVKRYTYSTQLYTHPCNCISFVFLSSFFFFFGMTSSSVLEDKIQKVTSNHQDIIFFCLRKKNESPVLDMRKVFEAYVQYHKGDEQMKETSYR